MFMDQFIAEYSQSQNRAGNVYNSQAQYDFTRLINKMKDIFPCRMQSVVHIAQAQRTENLKQCEPFIVEPFNEEVVRFLQVTRQINCLKSFSKNASKIRKPAFAMVDGNVLVRLKDVGYPCCFESFDEMTKGKGNLLLVSSFSIHTKLSRFTLT